jgi:hypothetical protein
MSNALAMASVTALLRNLLDDGMVDDTVVGSVGNVKVTALAPDLITLAGDAPSQLNLFLYQVTPNPGWRNVGLPSRNANGDRLTNPPLALDLHYLLTAYASRDLHAEILLGYAMQILHETPGLSREAIRRGLGDPALSVDPTHLLPPDLRAIATSELDEQVEAVKLTPQIMPADDVSKLWTALQSKLRPSVTYTASVVLIESKRATRAALPVRVRQLYVDTLRSPRIARLLSQDVAGGPILSNEPILARSRLVLRGTQLRGDRTLVRIGATTIEPDPASLQDTQIIVAIPAGVAAGVQSAQVIHERELGVPPTPHHGTSSNLVAFLLRPEIVNVALGGGSPESLALQVAPALEPGQRAIVLLNELDGAPDATPHAYSFPVPAQTFGSPPAASGQLSVPIKGVEAGKYLVRLQVEGAESPVFRDALGRYAEPSVAIP